MAGSFPKHKPRLTFRHNLALRDHRAAMKKPNVGDPAGSGSLSGYRKEWLLLCLFIGLQLTFTLFVTVPGHISVDEGTYHMMVKNFARSGTLGIWNGYEEFPSIELQAAGHLRSHDSRLVAQYPYLTAVLATPFYWIWGYRGLFFINSVAFFLTVLVCYALAHTLSADRNLALNSCLILVLATYLWEYSQAAFPHALAVFFVAGAAYCTVRGLRLNSTARSIYFSAMAGLFIGSGMGFRLDVILAAPALVFALALAPSQRVGKTLAFCAGLGPGLAALSITNHFKFGTVSPFGYGTTGPTSGVAPYVPLVLLGLVFLFAVWTGRKAIARWRSGYKKGVALGSAAAMLVAAILFRSSVGLLFQLFWGALQLLVDLRLREPEPDRLSMIRTASGAMVYIDGLKKSLLQSCSYLPVVLLPLFTISKRTGNLPDKGSSSILYLIPLSYCGVFSFFAWHGGMGLNLRYLLPILPFTSILTAWAWRDLRKELQEHWRKSATLVGLATVVLYGSFVLPKTGELNPTHEFWLLTFPLLVAGLIAFLVLLRLLAHHSQWVAGLLLATMIGAMVWSGLLGFSYDYPRSAIFRYVNSRLSASLSKYISPDSLVFIDDYNYVGLLEVDRVRLAIPKGSRPEGSDDFRDFRPLMDYHLTRDRNVYAVFRHAFWDMVRRRGLVDGIPIRTLWEDEQFQLVQFTLSAKED